MKKLVLFVAVVAAVSLSACKKTTPVVEENVPITVVEETSVLEGDSLAGEVIEVTEGVVAE